jgi:hypothetical protein
MVDSKPQHDVDWQKSLFVDSSWKASDGWAVS